MTTIGQKPARAPRQRTAPTTTAKQTTVGKPPVAPTVTPTESANASTSTHRTTTKDGTDAGAQKAIAARLATDVATSSVAQKESAKLAPQMSTLGGGSGGLLRMRLQNEVATTSTPKVASGNVATTVTKNEEKSGAPTGANSPPRADVKALLEQSGITSRPGRPKERILGFAAQLNELLAGAKTTGDVVNLMEKGDNRLLVFYLEGILKLYRKEHGEPVEKLYDQIKGLEDRAGGFAALVTTLAAAKEKGLPKSAIKILQKECDDARKTLLKFAAPFVGDGGVAPALKELTKTVNDLAMPSYADDKTAFLDELVRRADKATGEFDIDTLQGNEGLHELRRQLRWTLLYCRVGDGLITLDDKKNPVAHYTPLLQSNIGDTKYGKLPPPTHEDASVSVSQSLFFALNQLVTDIGDLKDKGELIEAFAAVLEKGEGMSTKKAHKAAVLAVTGDAHGDDALSKQAHAFYDEIQTHKPVAAFLADLKDG